MFTDMKFCWKYWLEIDALLGFTRVTRSKCLSSETLLETTFKFSLYQLTLKSNFKISNNNKYRVGHWLVLKNEAAFIATEENEWEIVGVKRCCVGRAKKRVTNCWNCRSKNECYDHWSAMHRLGRFERPWVNHCINPCLFKKRWQSRVLLICLLSLMAREEGKISWVINII